MRKIIFILLAAFISASTYSQNVGIGTTTPSYRLHMVDSVNDARAVVQAPVGGELAELQLIAGTNTFNFLSLRKYHPGIPGTISGIPKDNLSVLTTGGNSGTLLLSTGDGVSPIVFAPGSNERVRLLSNGQVSIGTSTPAPSGKLHVHDDIANQDVSIVMTNSLTGANNLRGMRLRFLNSDVILHN